jgi:hypothetical protein
MSFLDLLRDERAAGAAEFGLVLPAFLLFTFGLIDGGRLLWEVNRLEKATQAGARVAVVTNILPQGLAAVSYVGRTVSTGSGTGATSVTLTQGDRIPLESWVITCLSTGCTCAVATCPGVGTMVSEDFERIVDRMKSLQPQLTSQQVAVDYRSSGLGYAGDPNGMDVSPLVTVRIRNDDAQLADANKLKFRPVTSLAFLTFNLPSVATTLTAEDLNGSNYN